MRKEVLTLLITLCVPLLLLAQSRQVTGTVRDENGNLLPFVTVIDKGTNNGVVTTELGTFSITVSQPNATLQFTHSGQQAQELILGNQSNYNIALGPGGTLSEVIVTAFGIRKESLRLFCAGYQGR